MLVRSDFLVIHSGVYGKAVTIEDSGTKEKPVRFEAAPGENAVITGADAVRTWKKEPGGGNIFSAPWPHRFIGWNQSGTHPDDDEHRMIGRCEQVVGVDWKRHHRRCHLYPSRRCFRQFVKPTILDSGIDRFGRN